MREQGHINWRPATSPEEKAFVEKMADLCQQVEARNAYSTTHFLNPREEELLMSVAHQYQLQTFSSRDFVDMELARVIVAPSYYSCQVEDFEVVLYRISYPYKFYQMTHAQVLGTLLNRLSIRRECLGDIVISEQDCYLFLEETFASLIEKEITKIGRAPVTWIKQEWNKAQLARPVDGQEKVVLVSSLRLDKLIAAGFGLSRSVAVQLVEKGQVRLHYQEVNQPSRQVEIGQRMSVRGHGRLEIVENLGFSKQGKIKLAIHIIKK